MFIWKASWVLGTCLHHPVCAIYSPRGKLLLAFLKCNRVIRVIAWWHWRAIFILGRVAAWTVTGRAAAFFKFVVYRPESIFRTAFVFVQVRQARTVLVSAPVIFVTTPITAMRTTRAGAILLWVCSSSFSGRMGNSGFQGSTMFWGHFRPKRCSIPL